MNSRLAALTACLLVVMQLTACVRYEEFPPGTVLDIEDRSSAILELQEVRVPPPTADDERIIDYRVGPGDVLHINIPGLIDQGGTDDKAQNYRGFRISAKGMILLPLIGAVEVNGLTVEEIQATLTEKVSIYLKKPMVSVEIREFKSQPLYLLGKFRKAGLHYLDRPTNLLHGLALGNGLEESADLRSARVLRDHRVMPVDVYQLLHNNDTRQNIQLRPGDTIFVPGNEDQQVFVFGAVGTAGPVTMKNGRLNLLQALTSANVGSSGAGGDRRYPYDHEQIRIIRSLSPTRGQLMVVDLGRMMNGQVLPMPLMNGDIIFVPETPVATWNEAISQLLPTLQLISGLLQPFVQIEYLRDN
ncbi:MAG: polysaccharide biosynthesis/export family protein [Desulfuromonadales bacterium]|nr:polysaccharide biosynthesis/export family protein [Desulfuromonadales bacterium]